MVIITQQLHVPYVPQWLHVPHTFSFGGSLQRNGEHKAPSASFVTKANPRDPPALLHGIAPEAGAPDSVLLMVHVLIEHRGGNVRAVKQWRGFGSTPTMFSSNVSFLLWSKSIKS